ncbi:glycosyltransferase [Reichenbachiella sp.]|uniref:glycosyltransferase family 2 protein n=1 Tax=Reichenbachiella sp. TaxID=2184521 RepID=UPI00329A7917
MWIAAKKVLILFQKAGSNVSPDKQRNELRIVMVPISVLLPVYNAEKYLGACLESLLNQSYSDFELIIFNDASTDNSLDIILAYDDPRIKIINSPTNLGYVAHLNHGIAIAKGKYIARMDADDISMPNRFEKQISFLEQNHDYSICGTWVEPIDQPVEKKIWQLPSEHPAILIHHFFYNTAIAHPSVMFRKETIDKHHIRYDPSFMPAEDYELWSRISNFTKFKNITEPLLKYRQHPDQISQVQEKKKKDALTKIRNTQLQLLDIEASNNSLALSTAISNRNFSDLAADIDATEKWLMQMYHANQRISFFDDQLFNRELGYLWWMVCTTAANTGGRKILKKYISCMLRDYYQPSQYALIKFQLKTFLSS